MHHIPKTQLGRAYLFFKAHAGYVVGEHSKCSLQLARAEKWAKEENLQFTWVPDPDGYHIHDEGRADSYEGCLVRKEDEKEVLASLWGIGDADSNYRRVVEAELALEAMHMLLEREDKWIDFLLTNVMA